jgi:hypothetical protein
MPSQSGSAGSNPVAGYISTLPSGLVLLASPPSGRRPPWRGSGAGALGGSAPPSGSLVRSGKEARISRVGFCPDRGFCDAIQLAPDRPIFWFSACSILRRSHEQASTPFDVDVGDVLAIRGPKRSNET